MGTGPLTKQETRAHVIRSGKLEPYSTTEIPVTTYRHLAGMADRLAQYERDLFDESGKDRSQDTDWLRAGFLRRGAEVERLEDGILRLATGKEGVAQVARQSGDEDTALRAERDAAELRALLGDDQ